MELTGNWSFPTRVRFGAGRVRELGRACSEAGMSRPLLVTDRGLSGLDITRRALGILESEGYGRAIFSDVDPNPSDRNLADGIRAFLDGGHDGVVAFGGGSGLDLGKAIAFMARQTRPVWDFEDIGDWWTRADATVIAPNIAVPTTAGTGSEVGRASVITNSATEEKKIIFHPRILPVDVICDPELTLGLPPAMTAGTGMDAFAHCLEAYCSPHFHPMSQGIAVEGLRIAAEFLPRAHADGSDIEARAQMMAAASMGAVAFQKGLGAIHALSHPIGARYGTHHGTTNAVVMRAVLAFNRPAIERQIERAAAYLRIDGGFDGFLGFVVGLTRRLGIPDTLGGLGVADPDLDWLTARALADPTAGGNPIKLTVESTRALYRACL
ncbi:MAG: iron-containing alcohol dehydrogenase [Paracoccaceae bacterium]|nr:iron-containing alcohol dehydrogenase [Paracoccaceae bacterium]